MLWRQAAELAYKEFEPVFKALEMYDKGVDIETIRSFLRKSVKGLGVTK